jgi:hypothetical protein
LNGQRVANHPPKLEIDAALESVQDVLHGAPISAGNRVHVTVAEEWDQIKETLDSIEEMVAGEGFEPPTYGL